MGEKLECQPLITAVKKHTRTLNNLNASIGFLRKDLVDFYKELEEIKRSRLYRALNFLRGK